MKFRMFEDTQPVPFSQSFAIRELMRHHGGSLIAAGECGKDGGTFLYVKMQARNIAELIVFDDGSKLHPRYVRIDEQQWHVHDGKEFVPDSSFVFETV